MEQKPSRRYALLYDGPTPDTLSTLLRELYTNEELEYWRYIPHVCLLCFLQPTIPPTMDTLMHSLVSRLAPTDQLVLLEVTGTYHSTQNFRDQACREWLPLYFGEPGDE